VGGLGQQVAGHQYGPSLVGQLAEQVAHPADPVGVKAFERLVQDQHGWVAEQGGGQGQPLAHAQGKGADPAAGGLGQADQVQHLSRPVAGDPGRGGHDAQMLEGAAAGVEAVGLERGPDGAGRVRQVAVADAADGRGAAVRRRQAEQHPQRGGLAGAVGPEEAGDPAGPDLEGQVVNGGDSTVPLGEVINV
jgi:hypothetical protein